jgi:N-acyl-D-aspartate/D-glutamate deacylase
MNVELARMRNPRPNLSLLSLVVAASLAPAFEITRAEKLEAFSSAVVSSPEQNGDAKYDLIIRGGHVVDGTGNPWYLADVAVEGDRIAAVGRLPAGAGKREIDATGLVVAPGFIDMHSHSDWVLLEDGDAQSKVRQGVTTEVLGEGSSAGPWTGKLTPRQVDLRGKSTSIASLGDYFRAIESSGVSVNVVSYVGIGNVWESVMGQSHARPTREQLEAMKVPLAAAMDDGAFGLSSQVMMPPGSLATTDEIVELCEVVRRFGGIYSTHIRNEGDGVFDSIKEAIAIGERAGVPVDILHLKIADQKFWGRMNEVVALIDDARRRGVNVQANIYPYTRGNNNLASIIPPWAHEGGSAKMLERLRDPAERKKIKKDIVGGIPGWYNHYTAVGGDWARMLVNGNLSAKNKECEGMTMDRIIERKSVGKDIEALDVLFNFLIEEGGSVSTIYAHHTEEDMNLGLQQPWCSIGSDGSALAIDGPLRRGNPHPRSFGTFPRVLGVYVRKKELLRLEDAVRKMTSLNAAKLGIRDRGLVRAGCIADLTLFDPNRVIDQSTYTDPFRYSDGIAYVLVNGQLVLDRSEHTGSRPGRVLRHEIPKE